MDDLWGDDDLDADVVEECVMIATQASNASSYCTSPIKTKQEPSFTECKNKYSFEFKQPNNNSVPHPSQKATPFISRSLLATDSSFTNSTSSKATKTNLVEEAELERLREENRKLSEANLIKNGETTILRADLQNLRTSTEKRELEKAQEIVSLRKQVQQMDMQHSKQLEAARTEMKFKELELEDLRNKCKKIELNIREQKNINSSTSNQESPSSRKFLNKTAFEIGKRKIVTTDAGIQTEVVKRFRLDSFDAERLDNATDTAILVETLKFSLLSSIHNNATPSYQTVLEQLKMRMITGGDQENLVRLFHSVEPSVAEIICSNLERVKNSDLLKSHVEFLACWITHILPLLDNSKQDQLIQTVLSEVRRTSFFDTMTILSAIIARFGLAQVCNRKSGCLLEKVALNLKDAYPSLNSEEQFRAARKLVLTLSSMRASPPDDNLKKCACIPHLLKSLVSIIQHQTELDELTLCAAKRRLEMLVQAFRLSLSILSSRREPWLTFKQSPAEVNRLFTVLTAISVEFPIPNEISREINVTAFTVPGFGV